MSQGELWQSLWDEASEKFHTTGVERFGSQVLVSAAAGTGSRIVVHAVQLGPEAASVAGGPVLVSVLYPWQACYPVTVPSAGLVDWYVCEKFAGHIRARDRNGGDMAGVTLAIRKALDVLDEYDISPTCWEVGSGGTKQGYIQATPRGTFAYLTPAQVLPSHKKTLDEAALAICAAAKKGE